MSPDDFDAMVEKLYRRVPARFRSRMKNVAIVIEEDSPGGSLLGLYQGRPLPLRSTSESFAMPDRITIYQRPHERMARDRDDLERMVEQTLWHEIAHYFGMNEPQVRAAERMRRRRRLWPH